MKISFSKITPLTGTYHQATKGNNSSVNASAKKNITKPRVQLAPISKNDITFKGYYGDIQPAKKLFYIVSGKNAVYEDAWTHAHTIQAGIKKWVNAHPIELMKRTPEQAIQSICTLIKPDNQYPGIPACILSPNFGDNWGRHANYIEINPRAIAKYKDGNITDGLLQTIKLLPAIPTSPNSFANCIILSQLYTTLHGDGTLSSSSQYSVDLHRGISKNLTSEGLVWKMGEDEQVKAFNDLAHILGFKTGFRMILPEGQIRLQGNEFKWDRDEKAFIDACVWGIELGFDSIYFDSGKHVVDMNGFCGIGKMPNKEQMKYILSQIREKTGRKDLSFIGEKCDDRAIFGEVGYTAGTDWGKADDFYSVKWEAMSQADSRNYAAGPEVSNDNDDGKLSYSERLNRLNSCLFGFNNIANKLPSFIQLHDIMPLSPYVNTHGLMMQTTQIIGSQAWTEPERHWDGIFASTKEADVHRNNVNNIFINFIKTFG